MKASKLIREYRKIRGRTQDDLAAEMGLSKAYISAIENGKKALSFKQLLRFGAVLEIPSSEIQKLRSDRNERSKFGGESFDELLRARENLDRFLEERGYFGDQERIVMVPVVGRVPAGNLLMSYEDAVELSESKFPVSVSEVSHGRCFFLRVFGDSMVETGIVEGDLVLIDPEDREISGIGRVMAVDVDGEVTLKTVLRLDDRRVRLVPENSRYAPIEVDMKRQSFRVIGSVLPFMARWNEKLGG